MLRRFWQRVFAPPRDFARWEERRRFEQEVEERRCHRRWWGF